VGFARQICCRCGWWLTTRHVIVAHRNPADAERERTYSSAVTLGRQLDELAGNLGTIIGEINSAKGVGAIGSEEEKGDGGDEDAVGFSIV